MQLPLKSISSNPLLSYRIYIYTQYISKPSNTHMPGDSKWPNFIALFACLFMVFFCIGPFPPESRHGTWKKTNHGKGETSTNYRLLLPTCLFSGGAQFLCKGGQHQHQRQKTTSRPLSSFRSSVATWRRVFLFRVCLSGNGSFYRESTKSTMVHENNLWGWFGLLQHWFVLSKPQLVRKTKTQVQQYHHDQCRWTPQKSHTVCNIWEFPQMVVPPKHSKMITSSRKTHGC